MAVSMQVPATPLTVQTVGPGGGGGGEEPPKSESAASAWAMRFDEAQAPQIS